MWPFSAHNGCGKSTLAKHFNAILLPSGGQGLRLTAWTPPMKTGSSTIRQNGGHGVPEPGQPDRGQRGGGGRGLRPWKIWALPAAEIRRRVDERPEAGGHVRVPAAMRPICSPAGRSSGSPSRASSPWSPKCIVLDEPTAMLDPRGPPGGDATPSDELNREKGITVVLITHHMDEAAKAPTGSW